MEAIIDRLRELEAEEVQILKDHKALLAKRAEEDERGVRERAEEDEAWQSRLRNRDHEEDASPSLRRQRRELSRASLADVLSIASIAAGQKAKTKEPCTFGPSNDTESTVITPRIEVSATVKKARTSRAKETKPRTKNPKNVMQSWSTYDSRGRSLYLRPSDGQLVYLECYFPGCGRTDFKNIRSIMRHVSDMRIHGGGKGSFRNHAHVIEVCGKLPPEHQALREEEEEHRKIEPFPHQEQIAHEPEPSIPVSSLSQPATAYAIEQDSDGFNSREATSITSPNISGDTSVTSMTPIMAMHDVTIKKEIMQDVGDHHHIFLMAQNDDAHTHECLSANETEGVALPEYVSSMSYDTDDGDVNTEIHPAIKHRATARPRYLPELAFLGAGQTQSMVDKHPEVQIKREGKGIEVEHFAPPVTANSAAAEIQKTDRRIEDITETGGDHEIDTELADASVPFGIGTLAGGSDSINAGLWNQPFTANVAAVETPETDGRITDPTERIGKPEVETEHADAFIRLGNCTLVGGSEIDAELFIQPVTANIATAAKIQETDGRIGDSTDLGDIVADSHQASEQQLAAHISSNGCARTTGSVLCKGVSHKRASSIALAILDTTAQKRWRYDSYTFGPSSY